MNLDLTAIGDSKQLLIMTVDKSDAPLSLTHVTIQPVFHITVAIKIVFALVWVQAQKVGVFLGINTNSVVVLLGLHLALRCAVAVTCKSLAIMKDVALFAEGIDDLIKFRFELRGFQVIAKLKKDTEKGVTFKIF